METLDSSQSGVEKKKGLCIPLRKGHLQAGVGREKKVQSKRAKKGDVLTAKRGKERIFERGAINEVTSH